MRLSPEVLATLEHVTVEGSVVRMPQMDRKLYENVNKALLLLGGKWNRIRGGHVFEGDPGDRINDAVATGQIIDPKKEFQFFETPPELARRMVKLCGLMAGQRILEPSAGSGSLIRAAVNDASGFDCCRVTAVELDPKRIAELQEMRSRFLNATEENFEILQGDFLKSPNFRQFGRIVMNPPFRNGQDLDHVRHAYALLKPNGRMVAITSPGWTFRNDTKHREFREWLVQVGATWEEVPEGAFKASGTNIRTMLITIEKGSK